MAADLGGTRGYPPTPKPLPVSTKIFQARAGKRQSKWAAPEEPMWILFQPNHEHAILLRAPGHRSLPLTRPGARDLSPPEGGHAGPRPRPRRRATQWGLDQPLPHIGPLGPANQQARSERLTALRLAAPNQRAPPHEARTRSRALTAAARPQRPCCHLLPARRYCVRQARSPKRSGNKDSRKRQLLQKQWETGNPAAVKFRVAAGNAHTTLC